MKKFNSGDSSTSPRNSENRDPIRKFCDYGLRARVCTSSKGKNIGKKFMGYANYGVSCAIKFIVNCFLNYANYFFLIFFFTLSNRPKAFVGSSSGLKNWIWKRFLRME